MKKVLLVTVALYHLSVFAQEVDSVALKYQETILSADLKARLQILVSEEFKGRETATDGNQLAADYLQRTFSEIGIKPLPSGRYFQNFPLILQEQKGIDITIGNRKLEEFKHYYPTNGIFKNGSISGKLEFIKADVILDTATTHLEGKVAVYYRTKDNDGNWQRKIEQAHSCGAEAVVLVYEDFEEQLERTKKRSKHDVLKLAEEGVYQEDLTIISSSDWVEELIEMKLKKVEKKLAKENKSNSDLGGNYELRIDINRNTVVSASQNVLGYIPGKEIPDELVIVTAHYDHLGEQDGEIYYGADDDGSGTTALLELAEAFALAVKDGVNFKRSILFMPVSGEEKGLLGSRYYVTNPVFPLEKTIANLNIDMIGRHDAKHLSKEDKNYVYLIGSDRLSEDLHQISESANSTYTELNLDYTFNDEKDPNRFYYRSDHYNFAKNKVPVIFYFSGVHEDYHKPSDTIDKIDFEALRKRTLLVFHTAWKLLNAEERPALK